MRASVQCVNMLKNMRAVKCVSKLPLRPWSTRSNHGFGLPKLRRFFKYVSVSVRVLRSENLENSFPLYRLMTSDIGGAQ